jgi:hypothetical protein
MEIPDINSGAAGVNYYKDLSSPPPVTTEDDSLGDVDVLLSGSSQQSTMQADNGAILGIWNGSTAPTKAQCLAAAQNNGVPTVDLTVNETVCVETANDQSVASLKLLSINGFDSAVFNSCIWYTSNTP